jgi:hypothetical protein
MKPTDSLIYSAESRRNSTCYPQAALPQFPHQRDGRAYLEAKQEK